MSTADKIESVILKVLGVSVAVWGVRVLKAAAERKAHEDYYSSKGAEGVGAAERIKRRIYKEVSMAQDEGVDFSKKFPDLTGAERDALIRVGNEVGWKQSKRSIESGKSYAESYFGSLRRAWNAVSGCKGIGKAWNVRDAQGNTVLTWIEDAAAHVQQERDIQEARERALEADARATEARKRLNKARRAIERVEVPRVRESKQQEILDKFPHLKIMDDPNNPIPAGEHPFSLVLWKIVKNDLGEKSYEGAAMAFTNRTAAESAKAYMKRDVRSITHPAWESFYERMRDEYDKRFRYGAWHSLKDDNTQYLIKDVSKVKLDNIAGVGVLSVEDGLEPELLEFVRQNVDPRRMSIAFDQIDEMRCPLSMAEPTLYDNIIDLVEEWCLDNAIDPDSIWSLFDAEDIFWAL